MRPIINMMHLFFQEEDGPTAVEYAVMLALIIMVCFAAVQFLGQQTSTSFTTLGQSLESYNTP